MIQIVEKYCPKNHACPAVRICPYGAISQESTNSLPKIDHTKCIDCGECTEECIVFQYKKGV